MCIRDRLYANEIKTINGRKYAFNEYGRMLDGLMLVDFATTENSSGVEVASTKDIVASYEDDDANYNFETEDDLDATIKKIVEEGDAGHMSFMYFGDADDGSVKTGKQSIDIDGDKIDFEFNKSGSKKGQGRNEVDKSDKVAYAMGKKYKADSDNKYEIILELKNGVLVSLTTEDYVNLISGEPYISKKTNGDEDNKYYLGHEGQTKPTVYDGQGIENTWVVNTSGSLVKTKSKCKDGDDYIIKVDNYVVKEIYEELD